jgi:hypothetical protein
MSGILDYAKTISQIGTYRYEMKFAQDFSCIIGGFVNSVPRGTNEEMDMSKFCVELVYANVGLLEKLRNEAGNDMLEYTRKLVEVSNSVSDELETQGVSELGIATLQLKRMFLRAPLTGISYPNTQG